jgi:hypothetical protein
MIEINPASPVVESGFKLLNGAKVRFPASPLEIKLYYGRHGNEHVLEESFADDLHQADLFCFESMGWQKWQLDLTQRVADGDPDAVIEAEKQIMGTDRRLAKSFAMRMYSILFASNVKVHFPDVPKNHPYFNAEFRAVRQMAHVARPIELGDDFLIPDNMLKKASTDFMNASVKRDRHVLEHFFPKDIEPKPIIRVVGFFGLMHSATATSLARQALKQNREDISVMTNTQHEAGALYKFLNGENISRAEYIQLIRYQLDI